MAKKPVIEDTGRVIEGAKKHLRKNDLTPDYFDKMSDSQRQEFVKKDNVWHKPDYAKIAEEKDNFYAAFVKAIRDKISALPCRLDDEDYDTAARNYVGMVNDVRDMCEKFSSPENLIDSLKTLAENDRYGRYVYANSKIKRGSFRYSFWTNASYDAHKLVHKGFPDNTGRSRTPASEDDKPWMKNIRFGTLVKKPGIFIWRKARGRSIPLDNFLNFNDPIDPTGLSKAEVDEKVSEYAKKVYESALAQKKKDFSRPHLKHLPDPAYKGITAEEMISTFGISGIQFGEWVSNDERQFVLDQSFSSLMNMSEILGVEPYKVGLGGKLGLAFGARGSGGKGAAAAHYEPGENVINLTKINGAGSLAHEWFHAFDQYMARQYSSAPYDPQNPLYMTGRHKSQYESGSNDPKKSLLNVVALDKFNSKEIASVATFLASTILRKYPDNKIQDALDNAQDHYRQYVDFYERGIENNGSDTVRESLISRLETFKKCHDANMALSVYNRRDTTDFYSRSTNPKAQSAAKVKYYGSIVEIGARCFESSIQSKLDDQKRSDPYLVNGIADIPEEKIKEFDFLYPYPVEDERKDIAKSTISMFNTLSPRLEYDREITRQYVDNFEELEESAKAKRVAPENIIDVPEQDIEELHEKDAPEVSEPKEKHDDFKPDDVNHGNNFSFGF